ncbi:unnamed protein product [Mesocestoides corti]|uniref:Protein RFT1 homolog n=1 Tax=Mesocestoides corti TaxID=53468 RepID=A0A0R3U5K0_MESCO|nr:unnamed protein product [Mesocestoides corti]
MIQNDEFGKSSKDKSRNLVNKSLLLAEYTFVLQVLLRVITFALNGLTYRWLDADFLGLVNFRLALYYSTLVFMARESFRRACLSRGGEILFGNSSAADACANWRRLLNVMWLTVPTGALVSCVLLPIWIYLWPSPSVESVTSSTEHQYIVSCLIYTLSAMLELITEPMWLVCQLGLFVRSRIVLEATANIARAVGVVVAVYYGPVATHGLYLLTCPQILHGTTLLLGYVFFAIWLVNRTQREPDEPLDRISLTSVSELLPNVHKFSLDWSCLFLSWSFFRQGILKQFLTEGERYLISAFHLLSFADQGIYDLVNNIGSLAPRLLFYPIEESCHLLFSQCIQRELPPKQQNEVLLRQAMKMFRTSLRVVALIAWLGFAFSQAYSRLLLYFYGGSRLVNANPEAANLLRLFALYLVLLAWNGPTEAFLGATMTAENVRRHSRCLAGFSVVFLGASWCLVPLCGAAGFILANCVNVLARIIYSCYFINRFVVSAEENHDYSPETLAELRSFSLLQLMFPSRLQTVVLVITLFVTLFSEVIPT